MHISTLKVTYSLPFEYMNSKNTFALICPNNKHTQEYEIRILFLQGPPPEGDKSPQYLEVAYSQTVLSINWYFLYYESYVIISAAMHYAPLCLLLGWQEHS